MNGKVPITAGIPEGMVEVPYGRSLLIYGGYSETVGSIVEFLSYCAGAAAKIFYLAEQDCRRTLAWQFERGEQIIWK